MNVEIANDILYKMGEVIYFTKSNKVKYGNIVLDTTIGNYTYRAGTHMWMYKNGNVRTGRPINGSEIIMNDGTTIKIKNGSIMKFYGDSQVSFFQGAEDYYDKKTNLTYDTNEGLFLNEKGNIKNGYVYPFTTEKIKFSGGAITINKDGEIDYIN